jgi:hypothetical protein
MVSEQKKVHRVQTSAIAGKYDVPEQIALYEAFQMLIKAFPQERHFIIEFADANNGQGEKVWLIRDESETELIETMLLPDDY